MANDQHRTLSNDIHGTPHMINHTWVKTRVAAAAVLNSLIMKKQLVAGRCLGLMYGGSPGLLV